MQAAHTHQELKNWGINRKCCIPGAHYKGDEPTNALVKKIVNQPKKAAAAYKVINEPKQI